MKLKFKIIGFNHLIPSIGKEGLGLELPGQQSAHLQDVIERLFHVCNQEIRTILFVDGMNINPFFQIVIGKDHWILAKNLNDAIIKDGDLIKFIVLPAGG